MSFNAPSLPKSDMTSQQSFLSGGSAINPYESIEMEEALFRYFAECENVAIPKNSSFRNQNEYRSRL
jgi:hypothetical protein